MKTLLLTILLVIVVSLGVVGAFLLGFFLPMFLVVGIPLFGVVSALNLVVK